MTLDEIKSAIKTKPFYEEKNGVLYNADCSEIIKNIADKSIDLVLTDPPYGINIIGGSKPFGSIGGSKICNVNKYEPIAGDNEKINFDEIFRVSKNQVIFGGNYFDLPIKKGWIVWDKKCRNDWDDNFSDGELAWTSFDRPLKIFRHLYMGMMKQSKTEGKRVHPTQKPEELMRWIILNYSEEDDIILDPFCGSGTTCVAAKELGRKFIGIEISEKYCEISKRRLAQGILL